MQEQTPNTKQQIQTKMKLILFISIIISINTNIVQSKQSTNTDTDTELDKIVFGDNNQYTNNHQFQTNQNLIRSGSAAAARQWFFDSVQQPFDHLHQYNLVHLNISEAFFVTFNLLSQYNTTITFNQQNISLIENRPQELVFAWNPNIDVVINFTLPNSNITSTKQIRVYYSDTYINILLTPNQLHEHRLYPDFLCLYTNLERTISVTSKYKTPFDYFGTIDVIECEQPTNLKNYLLSVIKCKPTTDDICNEQYLIVPTPPIIVYTCASTAFSQDNLIRYAPMYKLQGTFETSPFFQYQCQFTYGQQNIIFNSTYTHAKTDTLLLCDTTKMNWNLLKDNDKITIFLFQQIKYENVTIESRCANTQINYIEQSPWDYSGGYSPLGLPVQQDTEVITLQITTDRNVTIRISSSFIDQAIIDLSTNVKTNVTLLFDSYKSDGNIYNISYYQINGAFISKIIEIKQVGSLVKLQFSDNQIEIVDIILPTFYCGYSDVRIFNSSATSTPAPIDGLYLNCNFSTNFYLYVLNYIAVCDIFTNCNTVAILPVPAISQPQYIYSVVHLNNNNTQTNYDSDNDVISIFTAPNTFDTSGFIEYFCTYQLKNNVWPIYPVDYKNVTLVQHNLLQCSTLYTVNGKIYSLFDLFNEDTQFEIIINENIKYKNITINNNVCSYLYVNYAYSSNNKLSLGAIIGISIGSILCLLIILFFIIRWYRAKKNNNLNESLITDETQKHMKTYV
jgi:hypothetical protein